MPQKTETYLTTLTPLRGIAALLVVIFHCNLEGMQFVPFGYTSLVSDGWLWVDFFFILSGFIMSYVYEKYFFENISWNKYKKFIGARFSRVYPLHFITTLWAFALAVYIVNSATSLDPFFVANFNPKSLPACLLLVQSLHLYRAAPLNSPSWSLSTEWWVYMIFPLLVPLFAKLKKAGKWLMFLFLVAFYLLLRYKIGPLSQNFPKGQPTINLVADFGWLRCLAGFLTGMLLFQWYKSKAAYAVLKNSWCFVFFFAATLVCMHFAVMDIIIIALFPFILLTAAYNNTAIKRMLDTRALQRLGDWSFSIYMVHVPIMMIFTCIQINKTPGMFADMSKMRIQKPDYTHGAIMSIVIVALTILVASLTYRFIEVPARNYLNTAFNTKRKMIQEASVEV